jgi:DNA-binding response OmpR family regulator
MHSKKILVIEDEALIRKTTCLLLSKENYLAISAGTGNEGIESARKESPDLILLDMMLPDRSGWDVLQTLKSDPVTTKIPIVIFTAADCEVSETSAREKGAAGLIHKPFYAHQILDVISTF